MPTIDQKSRVTRRRFFERSAGALAAARLLAGGVDATEVADAGKNLDTAKPDSAPIPGKIALEEHFALPGTIPDSYTSLPTPESRLQIQDLGSGRIAEMDRSGLELCILSESGPASIQTVLKTSEAVGQVAAVERLSGRAHRKVSQTSEGVRGVTDAGSSGCCSGTDTLR